MSENINEGLDKFLRLMPYSKVIADDRELRYRFRYISVAKFFKAKAQRIILEHGLRLEADLDVWERGGMIFEITLVVQPVPESVDIELGKQKLCI